jgi:hypothetical protein
VLLGYGLGDAPGDTRINHGARAVLAQEIRNARGGHYTFTVRASGGGTSADHFERVFAANFSCRLVLFRFANTAKDPRDAQVLASASVRPRFGEAATFTVDRFLGSTQPGANFAIGNGLGVAVVVEKTSPGILQTSEGAQAFVRIHSVWLEFQPRPRDDSVTV